MLLPCIVKYTLLPFCFFHTSHTRPCVLTNVAIHLLLQLQLVYLLYQSIPTQRINGLKVSILMIQKTVKSHKAPTWSFQKKLW